MRQIAATGRNAPDSTGDVTLDQFQRFYDPVGGSDGKVTFFADLRGSNITRKNRMGLWYYDQSKLKQLARAGESAPGGGIWADINSVVLPNIADFDSGDAALDELAYTLSAPRFVGRLQRGIDGVTANNDRGIWGVDSVGRLQLMLRTGQIIEFNGIAKVVKSFHALEAVPLSEGAVHGYNAEGKVAASVTFIDGQKGLLQLALP